MKSLSIALATAAAAFGFGVLAARLTASDPAAIPSATAVSTPSPALAPSGVATDSARPSEQIEAELTPATSVVEPPARAPPAVAVRDRTQVAVSRHKPDKPVGVGQKKSPPPAAQQAAKATGEATPPSAQPAAEPPPDKAKNAFRRPNLDLDRTGF